MQSAGLHWFRRKQRSLSRVVLAAFCLTWLQFAAAPCVMALDSEPGMAPAAMVDPAPSVASMPDGIQQRSGYGIGNIGFDDRVSAFHYNFGAVVVFSWGIIK